MRRAQDGMKYELASYNRAGLVHTKEVFFDQNVKSEAPRDNANYLYEMGKGEILDSPEVAEKVKVLAASTLHLSFRVFFYYSTLQSGT